MGAARQTGLVVTVFQAVLSMGLGLQCPMCWLLAANWVTLFPGWLIFMLHKLNEIFQKEKKEITI